MNTRRILITSALLVLFTCSVLFIFVSSDKLVSYSQDQESKSHISDLDDYAQLKESFESDSGKVRLISLLSPT
ncbi:MAG: hypothetical protein ACE5NG_08705 [bacterium]